MERLNKSPKIDTEQRLTDCCNVVSDIKGLQLLYNLNTDQALEVLRLSEMRFHHKTLESMRKELFRIRRIQGTTASRLDEIIARQYKNGRGYHD